MQRLRQLSLGFALTALPAFVGCSGDNKQAGNNTGTGQPGEAKTSITIRGSDTMLQLAQKWQEEFGKKNPSIAVTVNGGGSGTGIKALLNQTTDLANASRPIEPKEIDQLKKIGKEPKSFVVAQDALSIVVHPSNTVSELTLDQLKSIYQGKISNWKQLGGPDVRITINSRDSSSGTFKFFQEHVLKKEPFADTAQLQPATNSIVQNVSQDKGAIGYVGLGYVTSTIKAVKVKKDVGSPAVEANAANVLNQTYPLSRPLYMISAGEPSSTVKVWLDWVTGPEGQAIVKKLDFVPVK